MADSRQAMTSMSTTNPTQTVQVKAAEMGESFSDKPDKHLLTNSNHAV